MKRVLLLFLIAAAVSAQRPPTGRIDMPRIERPHAPDAIPHVGEVIEVSIVNVDVVVTDRNGERVHVLTKDDFEIRESGKPQPITNFAEYRGRERDAERVSVEGPGSAAPAPATVARPPRTLVLVVEDQPLVPIRRDDLFAALHKFIDQTMEPGDRAMVATWQLGSLRVKQAMTQD